MNKIHFPEYDHEEVLKAAGRIVTMFTDEVGTVKSAASSAFSESMIRSNLPDKDHFGVHFIAIGDNETYGFNRNGDGFSKEANKAYHHTFVDHGHFFREHKNTDPKLKIGDIKAAAYNEDMHRIEVIVHGDKKLAEEEYELVKAGKSLSCSMSCKIAYDVCSCCGNEAPNRSQYCSHLRSNMGQYLPEFKKFAYADNPHPVFFDLSRVKNPADRIAHHLEFMLNEHEKAASMEKLGGAGLAELTNVREINMHLLSAEDRAILSEMAKHEEYLEKVASNVDLPKDNKFYFVKHALKLLISPDCMSGDELDAIASVPVPALVNRLHSAEALLPYKDFYSLITGENPECVANDPTFSHSEMTSLPTSIRMLITHKSPALSVENCSTMFTPAGDMSTAHVCGGDDKVQKAIDKLISLFTMKQLQQPMFKLVSVATNNTLSDEFKKKANIGKKVDIRKADLLAGLYGMYKLSFVKHQIGSFLDDPKLLTITYFK